MEPYIPVLEVRKIIEAYCICICDHCQKPIQGTIQEPPPEILNEMYDAEEGEYVHICDDCYSDDQFCQQCWNVWDLQSQPESDYCYFCKMWTCCLIHDEMGEAWNCCKTCAKENNRKLECRLCRLEQNFNQYRTTYGGTMYSSGHIRLFDDVCYSCRTTL